MGFNRNTSTRFAIAFRKLTKGIRKMLLPKWLRSIPKKLSRHAQKAETSLFRTTKKASSNVAKSQLVQGTNKSAIRLGRSIQSTASRILKALGWLLGLVLPASFRRRVAIALSSAFKRLGSPIAFLGFWMRTRKFRKLLYAIPAILLVLPFGYFSIRIPFHTSARKAGSYQQAASKALEQKDFATAELYYRKLRQLNGINNWTEYQSAYYQYNDGQVEQAVATMKRLAPPKETGFTPAHVWLARYYFSGESELPDEDANRLSRQHIDLALAQEPSNATARALRAAHFKRDGLPTDAIRELRDIVQKIPSQRLSLAQLYYAEGKKDEALKQLTDTVRHFEHKVEGNAKLSSFEYQVWGAVKKLLGEHDEAQKIFEKGLAEHDDKMLARRAVKHFLEMADLSQCTTAESAARHVGYLMQAFEADPQDLEIIKRLVQLSFDRGPAAVEAQKAIDKIEKSPKVPLSFWSIVGTGHGLRNQFDESWIYLSKAVEATPDDPRVFNNAAWVLLQLNQDKKQALSLINRALAIEPDNAVFRETRGQVLLRFNEWKAAVEDLEFASNGLNNPSPALHEGLASAYENLNNTELARNHRQIAKRLRIDAHDVH